MPTYTLEQIDALNPAELSRALIELAPQVLVARATYDALIKQQRLLANAQILRTAGLHVGQRVRLRGTVRGLRSPFATVAEPYACDLTFQVLAKDGTPKGDTIPAFLTEGYDILED